jgi:gamma-glutamyl:cysteine ligase YbdK (ATP-grasp superfamily)
VFEILTQTPVTKSHFVPDPVKFAVQYQHKIIGSVAQETQPRSQSGYTIKQVAMNHEIVAAVGTYVFYLIVDFYQSKTEPIRYHGSQKFIVVAGYVDHASATFGMTQHTTNHIGMTLFPTPPVALYLPSINDVAHKIQCIAGVVLEKVV